MRLTQAFRFVSREKNPERVPRIQHSNCFFSRILLFSLIALEKFDVDLVISVAL